MEKRAKKHWRRIEVLTIIFALMFLPAFFLTRIVPEGGSRISAPMMIVTVLAPILTAWIVIELIHLIVAIRKPTAKEFGSAAQSNLYFLAWIAFIACALFVFYVVFGNVEWVNYFYYQIPPLMQVWLTAFAVIAWFKLLPTIFYKRFRPIP